MSEPEDKGRYEAGAERDVTHLTNREALALRRFLGPQPPELSSTRAGCPHSLRCWSTSPWPGCNRVGCSPRSSPVSRAPGGTATARSSLYRYARGKRGTCQSARGCIGGEGQRSRRCRSRKHIFRVPVKSWSSRDSARRDIKKGDDRHDYWAARALQSLYGSRDARHRATAADAKWAPDTVGLHSSMTENVRAYPTGIPITLFEALDFCVTRLALFLECIAVSLQVGGTPLPTEARP